MGENSAILKAWMDKWSLNGTQAAAVLGVGKSKISEWLSDANRAEPRDYIIAHIETLNVAPSSVVRSIINHKLNNDKKETTMKSFEGSVVVTVSPGMTVRISPEEIVGKIHKDKEFIIAGEVREICGTECVPLNNLDGTRFSAAYDLSMLQVVSTG